MNDSRRRRFERLVRCSDFITANAADFPQESKGRQAAERLAEIIGEIRQYDAERVSGMGAQKQATLGKRGLRASLRAQVKAVSKTNETIALDRPEFRGRFLWSGKSVDDQTLLATARSFAEGAGPHQTLFTEYGLPADFLQKLNTAIGAFEQLIGEQNAGTGARVTAGAALGDAIDRGEQELERMDTAVRNKYRDDPARLAAWESARRLERAPRPEDGGEPAQTQGGGTTTQP